MPPHNDNVFPTYTNVVFANGVLLVPTYPNIEADPSQALDVYRKLLPRWQVVGVDCSNVIGDKGALHCATMNLIKSPARTQQF